MNEEGCVGEGRRRKGDISCKKFYPGTLTCATQAYITSAHI